jgi:hypothetical protein
MDFDPPLLDQIAVTLLFSLGGGVGVFLLMRGQAFALGLRASEEIRRRHLRAGIGMALFGLLVVGGACLARDLGWRPEQSSPG